MDVNFNNNYIQSISDQAAQNASGSSVERLASSKVSENSTYEELEEATKSFESYFLEQVMKSVKETIDNMNEDENEDPSMAQMTDTFMDQTISSLSEMMVDKYGGRFTQDMTNQMARMYHIDIPEDKK